MFWVIAFVIIFAIALFSRVLFPKKILESFDVSAHPFNELAISDEDHVILLSVMKRLHDLLTENSYPYFLVGGSLMGAMRYQNRMPWDDDIDIGILPSATPLEFEKLPFHKYNLSIRKVWFGYKVFDISDNREILNEVTYPFVDVFRYTKQNDTLVLEDKKARKTWPREKFEMHQIFPLSECLYDNITLSCPGQAKEFLNKAYPGWDKIAYIQGSHTALPLTRTYLMPVNQKTTSEVSSYLSRIKRRGQ